jgi:hypothetical protein
VTSAITPRQQLQQRRKRRAARLSRPGKLKEAVFNTVSALAVVTVVNVVKGAVAKDLICNEMVRGFPSTLIAADLALCREQQHKHHL